MKNAFDSQPRIFVVDDDLDIAKMLSIILQMNLFDAVPHNDPQIALEAARSTPPDYLISDIMMPGMNGIQLALAMQQESPACKVLLFTGQDASHSLVTEAGAAGHPFTLIQKPIHPTKLVAAIREL